MKDIQSFTYLELAIFISDHLRKDNIDNVLTGGACVSIYSENKYFSYDFDFVLLEYDSIIRKIEESLQKIDFFRKGRIYKHPQIEYLIDILSPPLSIGHEKVEKVNQIKKDKKVLKLLSPTDCVKDRLAAYFHWNDLQSLEQALMVAKNNLVDLNNIRKWSKIEENIEKFKIFQKILKDRIKKI